MKDIREQIIDIIRMEFPFSDNVSIQNIADEILALPLYPKEFVEWVGLNTMLGFGFPSRYAILVNGIPDASKAYTLDELFDYWKLNIRDK